MGFELANDYENSWEKINKATKRRKLLWAMEGVFLLAMIILMVAL